MSTKPIRRLEQNIDSKGKIFRSNSIVQTDVVNDNFIRSREGLIASELMEFHSRNIPRYPKVAKTEYIEDLLKQVG